MSDTGIDSAYCPLCAAEGAAQEVRDGVAPQGGAVLAAFQDDSAETFEAPDPLIHAYALRLRGIRLDANIGVSAEERSVRQELVVDVDLTLSVDDLPKHDARSEVVDYGVVVRLVVEQGTSRTYRLLETYAKHLVARLLAEMPALRVRVAVTKKRVPTPSPVDEAIVELVASKPRRSARP